MKIPVEGTLEQFEGGKEVGGEGVELSFAASCPVNSLSLNTHTHLGPPPSCALFSFPPLPSSLQAGEGLDEQLHYKSLVEEGAMNEAMAVCSAVQAVNL